MWDDSYDDSFSPVQQPQTKRKTNSVDFDAILNSSSPDTKKTTSRKSSSNIHNNNNNNNGKKGAVKSKSQAFDADLLFSPSSASESNSPSDRGRDGKKREGRGGDGAEKAKEKKTYNFEENVMNTQKTDNYLANFAANSGDLEDSILGELLGFGGGGGGGGAKKKADTLPAPISSTTRPGSAETSKPPIKTFSPAATNKLGPLDSISDKKSPGLATSPVTTGISRGQREGRGFGSRRDLLQSNSPSPSPSKATAAPPIEYTSERISTGVRGHFNSFDGGEEVAVDSSNEFIPAKPPTTTLPSSKIDSNSLGAKRSSSFKSDMSVGATTSIPSFGARPSSVRIDENEGFESRKASVDNYDEDEKDKGGQKGGFVPSFLDPGKQGGRRRRNGDVSSTAVSMDSGLKGKDSLGKLADLDAALGISGPATAPKKAVYDPFARVESTKVPAMKPKPSFISDSSDDSTDERLKGKNRYDRANSLGSFVKQSTVVNNNSSAPLTAAVSGTATKDTIPATSTSSKTNQSSIWSNTDNNNNDLTSKKPSVISSTTNILGPLPALSPKPTSPQVNNRPVMQSSSDDELDISGIVKLEPQETLAVSISNKDQNKTRTTNTSDNSSSKTATATATSTEQKLSESQPGSGIKLSRKTVGSTARPSTLKATNRYTGDESVDSSTDQVDLKYLPTSSTTPASLTSSGKSFFPSSQPIGPAAATIVAQPMKLEPSKIASNHGHESDATKALSASAYLENLGSDDEDEVVGSYVVSSAPPDRATTLGRMNAVSSTNVSAVPVNKDRAAVVELTTQSSTSAKSIKAVVSNSNVGEKKVIEETRPIESQFSNSENTIQMILEHSKSEKAAYERRMQDELDSLRNRIVSYDNLFQANQQAASIHDHQSTTMVQLQVLQEQLLRSEQEKLDLKRMIAQLEIEIHRLKDEINVMGGKHIDEMREIKVKHENELKEKDLKHVLEMESVDRRHGESLTAMKKVHQEEVSSYKDRLKSIESMELIASQIRTTTGSMKYLEETLQQRHQKLESLKEGQYEAREKLISEMEEKARERIDAAESEAFRLKGMLSHMEHMLTNARTQSYEEKERLGCESQRMNILQEQLLIEKKVMQEQLQEERKGLAMRHHDLEQEISGFNQEKLLELERLQNMQRKMEHEKNDMENMMKRTKSSLEHYELRLLDEEKRIMKLRDEVNNDRLMFEQYKAQCSEEIKEADEVKRMLEQAMGMLKERSIDIERREVEMSHREEGLTRAEQQLFSHKQLIDEKEVAINEGFSQLQVEASRLASQEIQLGIGIRHIQQRNHELAVVESNVYSRKTQQATLFREQLEQGITPFHSTHATPFAARTTPPSTTPPSKPASQTTFAQGTRWSMDGTNPYRSDGDKVEELMQTPGEPIHDQFYYVNSVPPPPQLASRSPANSASSPPVALRDENVLNRGISAESSANPKKWNQTFQEDLRRAYIGSSAGNALYSNGLAGRRDLPKEVLVAQRVLRENKIVLDGIQSTSINARRILESDDAYVNSLKLKQKLNGK